VRGIVANRDVTISPPPPLPPPITDTRKMVQVQVEGPPQPDNAPSAAELAAASVGAIRCITVSPLATRANIGCNNSLTDATSQAYLNKLKDYFDPIRAYSAGGYAGDPIRLICCVAGLQGSGNPASTDAEIQDRVEQLALKIPASYYEIGNEVPHDYRNGTNWSVWFDKAEVAAAKLRAMGQRVILGAPLDRDTGSGGTGRDYFAKARARYGMGAAGDANWAAHWDGVAVHPYGQGGTTWALSTAISGMRTRLSSMRQTASGQSSIRVPMTLPVFITEWGIAAGGNSNSTMVANQDAYEVNIGAQPLDSGTITVSAGQSIPVGPGFPTTGVDRNLWIAGTSAGHGQRLAYTGINGARTQFTGVTGAEAGSSASATFQGGPNKAALLVERVAGGTHDTGQNSLLTTGFAEIWKRRFDTTAEVNAAGGILPAINLAAIGWYWWRDNIPPNADLDTWATYCGLKRTDDSSSPAYTSFAAEPRFQAK